MKLIIDISEDTFTRLFDNGIEDINVEDRIEIYKAIRKGIPFDKIKTEIESESEFWELNKDDKNVAYGLNLALEIINGG